MRRVCCSGEQHCSVCEQFCQLAVPASVIVRIVQSGFAACQLWKVSKFCTFQLKRLFCTCCLLMRLSAPACAAKWSARGSATQLKSSNGTRCKGPGCSRKLLGGECGTHRNSCACQFRPSVNMPASYDRRVCRRLVLALRHWEQWCKAEKDARAVATTKAELASKVAQWLPPTL